MMKKKTRKSISFLLALSLSLQCVFFVPKSVIAATSATAEGSVEMKSDGVASGKVNYTQTLQDNSDGTYSLILELQDASTVTDTNKNSTVSQNGYFVAPADGTYLVGLWGGDGGNGNPDKGNGGKGGTGGHVHAQIKLNAGDILVYMLGGDGAQTTSEDIGGGVNGNGGNAGASTNYTVGGGGGYSAIFLFEAGAESDRFLSDYAQYISGDGVFSDGFAISETDRTTKYIMIAGGGGGGGAGSGGILSALRDEGYAPNGGDGGSVHSASGTVTDVNGVEGTYFAGENGETSGTSTDYVGRGGTYLPGEVQYTWFENLGITMFAGIQPNDWFATYNSEYPGGNGGAGNLRGGSGGAGFTGGSGGMQTSIVLPTNVGGGGGGASYIRNKINGEDVDYTVEGLGGHPSETGGAVYITAVQTADSNAAVLSGVSLSLTPSIYFDVTGADLTADVDSEGNATGTYTISNIDLTGGSQTVTLTFTPKTGFAGGNGVPLLSGKDSFSISMTNGSSSGTMTLPDACAYVNVPITNLAAKGNNYEYTAQDGVLSTYELYKLYDTSVLPTLPDEVKYAFLDIDTTYHVYSTGGEEITEAVTPASTTTYTVGYWVTPNSDRVAVVGEEVTKTLVSDTATITVNATGVDNLNGNTVEYKKRSGICRREVYFVSHG